jgi:hypothetical protein
MIQVSPSVLAGVVARPESFVSAYGAVGGSTPAASYIRSQLGAPFITLSDPGCMATFASAVAYSAAPLGDPSLEPISATLQQLLHLPQLASGHFCKLATLLALLGSPKLVPPDASPGSPAKPTIHFLVWTANVPLETGAHSQLVISNVLDTAYLLLDPTYAYALRIPYVGAGPQTNLTVIENAAVMLQTPIAQENLAVLDPAGTASVPQMLQIVISGALGPQFLQVDSSDGSQSWDAEIATVFEDMG